jgi:hypothetical protein
MVTIASNKNCMSITRRLRKRRLQKFACYATTLGNWVTMSQPQAHIHITASSIVIKPEQSVGREPKWKQPLAHRHDCQNHEGEQQPERTTQCAGHRTGREARQLHDGVGMHRAPRNPCVRALHHHNPQSSAAWAPLQKQQAKLSQSGQETSGLRRNL